MPYAKTSLRAEKRALREKMRAMGLSYREIAAEFARRYRLRPRAAWREAYGWSLTEAARQINAHTGQVGLDPDGISAMTGAHLCEYQQWPGEGAKPTGRRPTPYLLALLASVYGCSVLELIDLADRERLPPSDLLILEKFSQARPAPEPVHDTPARHTPPSRQALALPAAGDEREAALELRRTEAGNLTPAVATTSVPVLSGIAYRRIDMSDFGDAGIERTVTMAAHEGSAHAERAEQRDIGEATLEQLHADVVRLSREYVTGEPFPLFVEMRRVRGRVYAALDRQLWPRDETDLYFFAGCLNCMMGVAANALGYLPAGEELIRAAWAYATVLDHRPLMAKLRLELASIAYGHRPRQARDLAASGLRYLADGPNAAHLHLIHGKASAKLGDTDTARRAVAAAHDAREREHHDGLLEISGEFGVSLATHHYFAGATLAEISGAERETTVELERAATEYAAGPGPGEQHWFGGKALTSIELASIRLRSGALDAAIADLDPVLSLPPAQRIAPLPDRLSRVRAELAGPRYQRSPQARELDERIEDFEGDTIVGVLHDLPGGPG